MSNRGGFRANAGRRANKDEVFDHIKKALAASGGNAEGTAAEALSTIWGKVIKEALDGNYAYTKLLFEYYYGKPVETTQLEVPEGTKITVTKQIVTAPKRG